MKVEKVDINKVKLNPNNPRIVKDDKFKKLVESIKTFPEMMEIRPIVVNKDMIALGGNMRLRACQEIGLREVPIIKAENLTPEQQKQFIIKDNVGFGEWDWDMLANEWDEAELNEWGLDLWQPDEYLQPAKEEEHFWQLTTKSDDQTSIMAIAADLKKRGYEVKVSEK